MINLKKMRFKNIGRFVDMQEIDFDAMPNICQIDGKNLNTNGSSGSGKSTIFQALEFVLGVNEVPTTILQSRLTKDGLFVELDLDKDGTPYTITRSKSDGLTITTPEGSIEGSNKIAEEYLQKLIGIPTNLLRKVFHKRQNEGGFFIGLTPKESYEFLTETLDLTSWTKKQTNISIKTKSETDHLTQLTTDLTSINAKIDGTNSVLNSIKAPDPYENKGVRIIELTLAADSAKNTLKSYQEPKNTQLQELKAPAPTTVAKPDLTPITPNSPPLKNITIKKLQLQNIQKNSLNNLLNENNNTLRDIGRAKLDLKETEKAIESLKTQIISIKSSICPTCTQNWVTEQAQVTLNNKVTEFKALMFKETTLNNLIATENGLIEVITKLKSDITPINPEALKPQLDGITTIEARVKAI